MYDYVLEREYRRARRLYITVYTTAVYYAERGWLFLLISAVLLSPALIEPRTAL